MKLETIFLTLPDFLIEEIDAYADKVKHIVKLSREEIIVAMSLYFVRELDKGFKENTVKTGAIFLKDVLTAKSILEGYREEEKKNEKKEN